MDLAKLNSATKYPSIPTYHAIDERGCVRPDAPLLVDFAGEEVEVTEKVDGTNARTLFLRHGDWFIGSREELLTARGDRIANPSLGIVETLRPIVGTAASTVDVPDGHVIAAYFEVYGAKVGGAAKQYTQGLARAARLFDIAVVPAPSGSMTIERIAAWREAGGQMFVAEGHLREESARQGWLLTPRLGPARLPRDPRETALWLEAYRKSQCVIDETGHGASEGVVVRTYDRRKIAKLRFDDYRKLVS